MKSDQSKADIWMPLYVADYVADTPYLTTEQHGAYLLLLMAYWRSGPPPDNDAILASLVKMTPDAWSIARAVLVHYFDVCEGFWIHKRVESEIEKAKKNRSAAHDKAAKAGKARWDRERERKMLEALPEQVLKQCPSPSPSTTPTKPHQEQSATPPDANAPERAVIQKEVIPYQQVADAYNEICGNLFPAISKLTDKRKRMIKARWMADRDNENADRRTDALTYWERYFRRATRIDFFRKAAAGENRGEHAGWRPSFDYLMREDTWLAVREGRLQ